MLEEYTYPHHWEEAAFPKEQYNDEYLGIKSLLESKSIVWYELSNFSKNGYECKHNKAYWNHSEMRALWLWSYGFENGVRYSYPENFKDYYAEKNFSKEVLTKDNIRVEKIMFWIRTSGFDEKLIEKDKEITIKSFLDDGYLIRNWNILSLWEKGIALMDTILADII